VDVYIGGTAKRTSEGPFIAIIAVDNGMCETNIRRFAKAWSPRMHPIQVLTID